MEFVETPLSDVVDFLKDRHDVAIYLNRSALDDEGIATDVPVTQNLNDITLRSALRMMLNPLHLDYVVENEVLEITTQADIAKNHVRPKVYPVGDLLASDRAEDDLASLAKAIRTGIAPWTWCPDEPAEDEEKRKPPRLGTITTFAGDTLLISQTPRVHEQIDALLTELRRSRAQSGHGR